MTTAECVGKESGECQGPIVADLVVQAKLGRRNVGDPMQVPLCVVHAVKGALLSWFARAGVRLLAPIRRSIAGGAAGVRLTHRIVPREPWRSALRNLGIVQS